MNWTTAIAERRVGRVNLSWEFARSRPDAMLALFKCFIPIEARNCFANDRIEYVGISPMFDPIAVGDVMPEYLISFADQDDLSVDVMDVVRVTQ